MDSRSLPNPQAGDCLGKLHPRVIEGFELFNQGHYWLAHEALEAAWLAEPGEIRHLYRGILQIAVTYYHITRQNFRGADKVYLRSKKWLEPFPGKCRGIDVARLQMDARAVMAELYRLGPEHIQDFDLHLLRPIYWE